MKSFLFRLYLAWMKFRARFTTMEDNTIVVLNGSGRSGSNGYAFYKWLLVNHPEFNTTLVEPWPSSHLKWETWQKIGAARYVITTQQLHSTTGTWDLVLQIRARNLSEFDLVLERVRAIPGVRTTQTNLLFSSLRTV